MKLVETIRSNFSTLLRCLDASNELLVELRSVAFVKDRIRIVNQQGTVNDKNNALLTALLEVPDDLQQSVMDGFIAALRSCGQDHVASIFGAESDKVPMSDEHHKMLIRQTYELCTFLDPENGVLDKLLGLEVITPTDDERIRSKSGFRDIVRELIGIIQRKSDDAFQALIETLNKSGQSHITFLLTGEGESRPLSENYRDKLKEKREIAASSIYPNDLVSALISKGVFTSYDQQRVGGMKTSNEKGEMILDLIARKSQAAFDGFIDTLQQHGHEHVVQELMGPEVAARIKAEVTAGKVVVDLQSLEAEIRENMQQSFANDETHVKQITDGLTPNGISVSQISDGSIIVKFRCRDYAALTSLQKLHRSKKLDQLFTEAFQPQFADKGLKHLRVVIPDEEFQRCADLKLMTSEHRKALESSAEWLADKMTVSDDLLDTLSLRELRRRAVKEAETSEQQVKTLLDIVSRQPDSSFDQLLKALDDTQQNEAASYLRLRTFAPRRESTEATPSKSGKNTFLEKMVASFSLID